jgi:hypothetical protein
MLMNYLEATRPQARSEFCPRTALFAARSLNLRATRPAHGPTKFAERMA